MKGALFATSLFAVARPSPRRRRRTPPTQVLLPDQGGHGGAGRRPRREGRRRRSAEGGARGAAGMGLRYAGDCKPGAACIPASAATPARGPDGKPADRSALTEAEAAKLRGFDVTVRYRKLQARDEGSAPGRTAQAAGRERAADRSSAPPSRTPRWPSRATARPVSRPRWRKKRMAAETASAPKAALKSAVKQAVEQAVIKLDGQAVPRSRANEEADAKKKT